MTSIKELNRDIEANAVELDSAHRYENGYDYSDEEFYTLQEKQRKLIEKVRKALEPKYEFPYYALIRMHSKRDGTFHIPAPMFNGMTRRSKWAGSLPIAGDKRDGEYYECPFCGEKSFYSGVCEECRRDFEVWEKDGYDGQWVDGPLPLEYRNHEAMKNAAKDELLRRIDTGVPDLGIYSAEIVLHVAWGAEWEPSPFLKCSDYSAQWALDRIEKEIRSHEKLKKYEEYQEMIRNYTLEDGVPLDYLEGDVITVEGTNELRRHVNGVWQHKHPEDGYDYWHPMARVHK